MNLLIPVVEVGVHNAEIAEDVSLSRSDPELCVSEDQEVRIVDHCSAVGSVFGRIKLVRVIIGDGNEETRLSHHRLLVNTRVIGGNERAQNCLHDAYEVGLAIDVLVEVCYVLRIKFEDQPCICHCLVVEGEEVSEDPELQVYSCLQQLVAEELFDVHPCDGVQLFQRFAMELRVFLLIERDVPLPQ